MLRLTRLSPNAHQQTIHVEPMPPKLRSSISKSLSRPSDNGLIFYCPSCSIWRRNLATRPRGNLTPRRDQQHLPSSPLIPSVNVCRRQLATPSLVSSRKNVPERFRGLYEALNRVRDATPEQVNISRLQLALRGLESEVPLIRVAG